MAANIPTTSELYDSAKRYALSALKVFRTADQERFPFYAGTALEHLTKACLVNAHPALLVELKNDPSSEDSLFILTGITTTGNPQLRTVSMANALKRVKKLFESQTPAIISRATPNDLSKLAELRNGQAHVASSEVENIEILVVFIQQAEASLRYLSKERDDFWNVMIDVVDNAMSENIDKVTRDVAIKMTQSRVLLKERTEGRDRDFIDLLRDSRTLPESDEEVRRCPVCRSFGIATGAHRMAYDVDEDGVMCGEWVEFLPSKFRCATCSLSLNSLPELLEAGLDEVWDSDMKPEEFLLDSYQDDDGDSYYGR